MASLWPSYPPSPSRSHSHSISRSITPTVSMPVPVPVPTHRSIHPDSLAVPFSDEFRPRSAPGGFVIPSPSVTPTPSYAPSYINRNVAIPTPVPPTLPPHDQSRAGFLSSYQPHYHSPPAPHTHHLITVEHGKKKKHKKHHSSGAVQIIYTPPGQVVQIASGSSAEAHNWQTAPHPSSHQHGLIPPPEPKFAYSTCKGRKKALCIGINYFQTQWELKGCVNDARHVRDALIAYFGYKREDIMVLTDDSTNPKLFPTRRNILAAFQWLVASAHTNDSLFLHYSGHGGQTKDTDGDEIDGFDEVIYPVDYKQKGHIVDDEMHSILVKPLPTGCRLTALFDSCHSGTVLDLPYIYSSSGRLRGSHVSNRSRRRKATSADVISWSGCKDDQTSADTFAGGVAVGAMSWAFITSLRNNRRQSYQQLLGSIRKLLYEKYTQKPQLGSSHPIDTTLQFVL